ncbi:MAG: MOSC N-terminal beta barrel domain-containing protein [Terracidiphilus sp.]|nr:MOSC N-terminal beta barrel domain-containing protein [Terracidiphilus sp.]
MELWRYPVKSMAGEQIERIRVDELGFENDRTVLVLDERGRIATSRTHHRMLGLKGKIDPEGGTTINGYPWDSPEALALVRAAVGPGTTLMHFEGAERFDVLPLLIATDGAISHMKLDGRRLRPNIIVGGIDGLEERQWPNHRLRIGDVVVYASQLRARCVMTTYDPDTLKQDLGVLKSIVSRLGGVMALDCSVVSGGIVRVGDAVSVID